MSVALTIAGSDPSGGAGLQADLKTFHQHRVYGMSVVTLLTVQNTTKVTAIEMLSPEFVAAQLHAVLEDIPPQAAKTGALGNAALIETVAEAAAGFSFPLVVDPVMISKHGYQLIDDGAVESLRRVLIPRAFLVGTPNRAEAERLTGVHVSDLESMEQAAASLGDAGAKHVLIKGGGFEGRAIDLLWTEGRPYFLEEPFWETRHTHGTGCVLSAAITARLARGESLLEAVTGAKRFLTEAIRVGAGVGRGIGPVDLLGTGPYSA